MLKRKSLPLAISLLFCAASASAVTITNPGFENDFKGWTDTDPSAISSDARTGSKSVKITGKSGRVSQTVKVSKNTRYRLRGFVLGKGTIGVEVGSATYDKSANNSDWKAVTRNFNSGSATSVTIFAEYNSGEGRFDDFALWERASASTTPTPTPSTPTPSTPTPTPAAGNAEYPSDLMRNVNQWKITYPDGVEDKTLSKATNEYFYVNNKGNAIVFRAPVRSDNGTTPNSSYIRSELRERTSNGSSDIYWNTNGKHVVYAKQAITHLPTVKNHLVATQIHGNKDEGIDDAMVLRLEGTHLFLSFNGGKLRDDLTIKTNYKLGTVHEIMFEVINGKHYVYYSEDGELASTYADGIGDQYLVKDGSKDYVMDRDYGDAYFKVGNYTQSNAEQEGNQTDKANNYGEVVVYDFWVKH